MSFSKDDFMKNLKDKATTKSNPNLDTEVKKKKVKNPPGKSIRLADYKILKEYAFFHDTTIQDAVALALEKLDSALEKGEIETIESLDTKDGQKSIRISEESLAILKKIKFKHSVIMLDIISAAVKLLK